MRSTLTTFLKLRLNTLSGGGGGVEHFLKRRNILHDEKGGLILSQSLSAYHLGDPGECFTVKF